MDMEEKKNRSWTEKEVDILEEGQVKMEIVIIQPQSEMDELQKMKCDLKEEGEKDECKPSNLCFFLIFFRTCISFFLFLQLLFSATQV